jgi:hypothetical protein
VITVSGTTSNFYSAGVLEGDSSFIPSDLKFTATLTSPPGMTFELYANMSPCGTGTYGHGNVVTGGWPDLLGTDESRTVIFEVRYVSGGVCGSGSWSLKLEGFK